MIVDCQFIFTIQLYIDLELLETDSFFYTFLLTNNEGPL